MKTSKLMSFMGMIVCLIWTATVAKAVEDSVSFDLLLKDMKEEVSAIEKTRYFELRSFERAYEALQQVLNSPTATDRQLITAWKKEKQLVQQIEKTERAIKVRLDQVRYRKGLELIKLMFEKILGLDHHFHSLQTYQNIMQLSNPNAYPAFVASREELNKKLTKKSSVQLPSILSSNPFLSASYSIVTSIIGGGNSDEKEADLEDIACILDFTVRMNADLNTIYYETEFLKESNASLKGECERLFRDYSKVIGYRMPLEDCRKEDDWENVYIHLENYILQLEQMNSDSTNQIANSRAFTRGIANLEFSIDRLLDFMDNYTDFINQGEKYYQKFQVIVSNYQNESQCTEELPVQFTALKQDIKYSIEKFKDAYFVAELKGSKLKDLLYGQ